MPTILNFDDKDMRHVRIKCRCQEVFDVAIPEMLADAVTVSLCPKCKSPFGAQRKGPYIKGVNNWRIRRIEPGAFKGTVAVRADQYEEMAESFRKDLSDDEDDKTTVH